MSTLFNTPTQFDQEVAMTQALAKKFFSIDFEPHIERWRSDGKIDRDLWRKAGAAGLLSASLPEEYGGGGNYNFMAAILLEQGRAGDASWGISVHNYVCHYILTYGTSVQKDRWLPKLASGEMVAAIAMTEPGAGSDLKAITTRAEPKESGYVINGQKTFISNGQTADLIVVAAKTDPSMGAKGISLMIVETAGLEGFRRGESLKKIGLHAADTSELFFDDVKVDGNSVLGGIPGKGFGQLMTQLPWERLSLAIRCVGQAEYALQQTLVHVKTRKLFGGTLFDQQNTQFVLADVRTKIEAMRSLSFDSLQRIMSGTLTVENAAMTKLFCANVMNEIVDACLQLFGGYGFMEEYPIARLYCDARALRIYGGSDEVMKLIISRSL